MTVDFMKSGLSRTRFCSDDAVNCDNAKSLIYRVDLLLLLLKEIISESRRSFYFVRKRGKLHYKKV